MAIMAPVEVKSIHVHATLTPPAERQTVFERSDMLAAEVIDEVEKHRANTLANATVDTTIDITYDYGHLTRTIVSGDNLDMLEIQTTRTEKPRSMFFKRMDLVDPDARSAFFRATTQVAGLHSDYWRIKNLNDNELPAFVYVPMEQGSGLPIWNLPEVHTRLSVLLSGYDK
jgi:hypothetical protein